MPKNSLPVGRLIHQTTDRPAEGPFKRNKLNDKNSFRVASLSQIEIYDFFFLPNFSWMKRKITIIHFNNATKKTSDIEKVKKKRNTNFSCWLSFKKNVDRRRKNVVFLAIHTKDALCCVLVEWVVENAKVSSRELMRKKENLAQMTTSGNLG